MSKRKRRAAAKGRPVTTQDSFQNPLTRTGVFMPNALEATQYPLTRFSRDWQTINSLYRSHWVVRRIIDVIPEDMTKNGYKITTQLDPDALKKLETAFRRTTTHAKLLKGLKWGRLYGGAGALIMIDGQEDILDQPLELDQVMPGSYKGLLVLDRWSGITPDEELIKDPSSPEFGLPETYTLTSDVLERGIRVHHSRILRFMGRPLPYLEELAENYWGASELEHVIDELRKRDNVSWNIAMLTFMANLRVLKMEGMSQVLATGNLKAQEDLYNTVQAQNAMMNNQSMMVLGENDDYFTHQYTFGGIGEVYDRFMMDLAGAAETPVTKLFGRSPAGMNATGESDMQNYYDTIEEKQENELRPVYDKLLPIIMMSTFGAIPDDFDYDFNPVRRAPEDEMADLASKNTDSVTKAFQAGLISQKIALKELRQQSEQTGMWSNISDSDIENADDEVMSPDEGMGGMSMGMGGDDGDEPPKGPKGGGEGGSTKEPPKAKQEEREGTTDSIPLEALVRQALDASYPKDPDPKNWRTIRGSHVHLTKGKIDGGAGGKFHGKSWSGKVAHEYEPDPEPEVKAAKPKKKATAKAKAPVAKKAENAAKVTATPTPKSKSKIEQLEEELKKAEASGDFKKSIFLKSAIKSHKKGLGASSAPEYEDEYEEEAPSASKNIASLPHNEQVAALTKIHKAVGTNPKEFSKFIEAYNQASPEAINAFYEKNPPGTLQNKAELHKKQKEMNDHLEQELIKAVGKKTVDKCKKNLKAALEGNDYGMMVDDNVLDKIFDSHFKCLQETGTSNGLDDPAARNDFASAVFQSPTDLPGFSMEKYGMLLPKDVNNTEVGAWGYGNVMVRFKKDRLKGRVTYTVGDSLSDYGMGEKGYVVGDAEAPSFAGCYGNFFGYSAKENTKEFASNGHPPEKFLELARKSAIGYVELQYHGALSPADIDSITIRSWDVKNAAKAIERAKKMGIKVHIV